MGRTPRLFAVAIGEPRARRATDAILLVSATVTLVAVSPVAVPPSAFVRALGRFLTSFPGFLDGLWQVAADLLLVLAAFLVVSAVVRRRMAVARDMVLAAALAAIVGVVALALGTFARALGYSIGLDELLIINISVGLLAGVMPVPGGIGVAEGGLTFGLVQAGMPESVAFAAVLMYRLATFYLPPTWGYFALRWLERNEHL